MAHVPGLRWSHTLPREAADVEGPERVNRPGLDREEEVGPVPRSRQVGCRGLVL